MRKYINKKSIFALIFAALLFLFIVNNYDNVFLRTIDESIVNWLLSNTKSAAIIFFELITMLASWQFIILGSIIMMFLVRDKILMLLTTGITGFVYLINDGLKNTFERPRPNVMHLTKATGYSLPSGHSIVSMVFYGLIILFFVSKIKDKKYRRLVQVLVFVLILLIGLSRVYLRVHFFSDVIAGQSLGLVILVVIYNIKVGIFDNITNYIEGEENE